jgi:hypothetical protein
MDCCTIGQCNKFTPDKPFALSLSKGSSWFDAPQEVPLGDKLTTNGFMHGISPNG